MKPEDKVTADRLIAAGTTQTPLTDAICPLGLWRDNTAPHYVIELAGHARSLELALAASKAREAELVKALEYIESEVQGALNNAFPEEAPDILEHIGTIAKRALQHRESQNSPKETKT